jgi:hypothetical protein
MAIVRHFICDIASLKGRGKHFDQYNSEKASTKAKNFKWASYKPFNENAKDWL